MDQVCRKIIYYHSKGKIILVANWDKVCNICYINYFISIYLLIDSFLSLSYFIISILISLCKNDKFVTKIFDKRDDFNCKLRWLSSLISSHTKFYCFNVFVSQIIQIARVCSDFQAFKDIFKVFILNFKDKGCSNTILQRAKNVFLENVETFSKFDLTFFFFIICSYLIAAK